MSEAPAPPVSLGPYVLGRRLAVGSATEVFRATHVASGRVMCLKRVLPHAFDDAVAVMMSEDARAKMALLAPHPHVVTLLDAGVVDGTAYVVTELVEEPSLADVMRRGPLPVADVLVVGMALCRGLAHVHDANCLHRHLSPRNVRGAKVDGVGEPAWEHQAQTGSLIPGRYRYLAPEQVRALPVDARADQWSVGVILWEALTGQRLFAFESTFDSLQAIVSSGHAIAAPSSLRAGVPVALDAAILRALSRDREQRFADMRAFEAALT